MDEWVYVLVTRHEGLNPTPGFLLSSNFHMYAVACISHSPKSVKTTDKNVSSRNKMLRNKQSKRSSSTLKTLHFCCDQTPINISCGLEELMVCR